MVKFQPDKAHVEPTRQPRYLHGIVHECPRTAETAVLLLLLSEPDQSILDVLLIYENVTPGLGKGLEDKGCEPEREKEQ